jgi:ABC-type multidrug transport system fused ATPase/permease subunit
VALFTVLALALAASPITAGSLTAGDLVTFYALIGLLAPIFQRITVTDRTLQEAEISVKRLSETLAEEPESPREAELPPLELTEGRVRVEEVSFEYPDGTVALSGASLEARRGEMVALAGPSGAGKSTLLELLPRFLEPTGGNITVDGQDIHEVSLGSLRSRIGFVSGDTPLLDGTIEENVLYGARDDAPEGVLERATYLSGVDELVEELPDGWETEVREGRRALSDGERQRVALARALAADPPILLIDGALSAVDDGTLRTVLERMRALAEEKTIIVATNRLPVLLAADRTYALQGGRTLEVSAQALRERGGNGSEDGVAALFAPPKDGGERRRTVRAAPLRRNGKDDHEDRDEEEDDE